MNKIFLLLIASSVVFFLSIIVLCLSPIINNTYIKSHNYYFSSWRSLNCKIYEDFYEDNDKLEVDDFSFLGRGKNLCRRKKSMHDLEYAVLIINLFFGFICANLSLLQYLNIGIKISKQLGIIGIICGFCGFILTFVYIGFNGYILTNDPAYDGKIIKKYPNGAIYKYIDGKYITAFEEDNTDFGNYIKYKDLADKQYNFDKEYYKKYLTSPDNCKYNNIIPFDTNKYITGCDYIFSEPILNMENKNLYNNWVTCLVFEVFVLIGNLCIFILGAVFVFKKKDGNELEKTIDN